MRMKRTLIMLAVLFSLGFGAVGQASSPVVRGGQDERRPCAAHCRDEARHALRRCHSLPPPERRECERRVHERLEACLRNCRDGLLQTRLGARASRPQLIESVSMRAGRPHSQATAVDWSR